MNPYSSKTQSVQRETVIGFPRVLRILWKCVRLPLLLILTILEPVVSFVLGSLALVGLLMSFFWWSIGVPHFPFVLMLGMSLGVGAILIPYYALLRLLAR
jgi:hypothetical protein